jgi:hypothetical protein
MGADREFSRQSTDEEFETVVVTPIEAWRIPDRRVDGQELSNRPGTRRKSARRRPPMKRTALFLTLSMLAAPLVLLAESSSYSTSNAIEESASSGSFVKPASPIKAPATYIKPLSRVAFGVGFSPLGINVQAATNLNRYLNLRASGNAFNYNVNNISTNGFNVDAKLNLASAGASLDLYPFPSHGFRISPGVLFYNHNSADATYSVQGGTTFMLNGVPFYTSTSDPVKGVGSLSLHTQNPTFTVTTGWGNMIPRRGGHWSFPLEVGVAFIGSPTLDIALNSGQVCNTLGQFCVDVATDQIVQSNLKLQVAKYEKDLDPLKTYPIVSFGVAYSFKIRPDSTR